MNSVKNITYQNVSALLLENEKIAVIILPEKGGKLVSILYKENKKEILFQNPKNGFKKAQLGSRFEEFEACGFDDAFPNIDEEYVTINGKEVLYPDHGEIWSAEFDVLKSEGEVVLFYHSNHLQYDYQKIYRLEDDQVVCDYQIINKGEYAFPYIWTMHCLVRIEEDMKLIFPENVEYVKNVFTCPHLGEAEILHTFPETQVNGEAVHLDSIPKTGTAKYYVHGKVKEGICGYSYPKDHTKVWIYFDKNKLPYLGFWVTAGGFRGDYNCALEPSSGYYDSIANVKKLNGTCQELMPNECLEFTIKIQINSNEK